MPTAVMPKTSMDYVEQIRSRKTASASQKAAKFNQIKASAADQAIAMNKIGQGFIGPVMMRLKYQGIVRNILTEDPIAPGAVPVYDVADEMGRAYFLEPYQAEAIISQYEGKRVPYGFRHIAEYATVQEQDFLELTIDMMEYAVNEAEQRIQELEDGYLFDMLDVAIDNITADFAGYAAANHKITSTHTGGIFDPSDFYGAASVAAENRLEAKNIVMNAADYYDMLQWDLTTAGVQWKDETMHGVPVTSFAGFNVFKSVICPKGTSYVLPESDYVGRMPIRKSLDIRNNDKLEAFQVGTILDEYVNLVILNSNGLSKITKS